MGIGIQVEELTKSVGFQRTRGDITFDLRADEVGAPLVLSGTGPGVFLKSLIGLLRPEHGRIVSAQESIREDLNGITARHRVEGAVR